MLQFYIEPFYLYGNQTALYMYTLLVEAFARTCPLIGVNDCVNHECLLLMDTSARHLEEPGIKTSNFKPCDALLIRSKFLCYRPVTIATLKQHSCQCHSDRGREGWDNKDKLRDFLYQKQKDTDFKILCGPA